jgi:hypothetical protein
MDDASVNDFAWWQAALNGTRLDHEGPQCGYYRDKRNNCAIGITRNEAGAFEVYATKERTYIPHSADALKDQFGFWCVEPISYDDFVFHDDNGRWPEDVEPYELDLPEGTPAHEVAKAHIEKVKQLADEWLASIGGKVESEAQDRKAQKYADRIAHFGKAALERHEELKAPLWKQVKELDNAWLPLDKTAKAYKATILAPVTAYRTARNERIERERREAEARLRAEQARIAAERQAAIDAAAREAAAKGAKPEEVAAAAVEAAQVAPVVPTVQLPPKPAAGMRPGPAEVVWDDRAAFWRSIAAMNTIPPSLEAEAEKLIKKWIKDGVPVVGAHVETKMVPK